MQSFILFVARRIIEHPVVQRLFSRLNLSSPQNQQAIAVGIFVGLFVLLLGSVAWNSAVAVFTSSDEKPVPYVSFDMVDAEFMCEVEMKDRLGDTLLRHYMDTHSSRLDQNSGIFRLYFKADIGDLYKYDEVNVHCFVDKWDKDLAYYREFNPNLKAIKSSDLKFFK